MVDRNVESYTSYKINLLQSEESYLSRRTTRPLSHLPLDTNIPLIAYTSYMWVTMLVTFHPIWTNLIYCHPYMVFPTVRWCLSCLLFRLCLRVALLRLSRGNTEERFNGKRKIECHLRKVQNIVIQKLITLTKRKGLLINDLIVENSNIWSSLKVETLLLSFLLHQRNMKLWCYQLSHYLNFHGVIKEITKKSHGRWLEKRNPTHYSLTKSPSNWIIAWPNSL